MKRVCMQICGWFGKSVGQILAYVDFLILSKSAYFILKTIGIVQLNGLKIMKETYFRPVLLPQNVY